MYVYVCVFIDIEVMGMMVGRDVTLGLECIDPFALKIRKFSMLRTDRSNLIQLLIDRICTRNNQTTTTTTTTTTNTPITVSPTPVPTRIPVTTTTDSPTNAPTVFTCCQSKFCRL